MSDLRNRRPYQILPLTVIRGPKGATGATGSAAPLTPIDQFRSTGTSQTLSVAGTFNVEFATKVNYGTTGIVNNPDGSFNVPAGTWNISTYIGSNIDPLAQGIIVTIEQLSPTPTVYATQLDSSKSAVFRNITTCLKALVTLPVDSVIAVRFSARRIPGTVILAPPDKDVMVEFNLLS